MEREGSDGSTDWSILNSALISEATETDTTRSFFRKYAKLKINIATLIIGSLYFFVRFFFAIMISRSVHVLRLSYEWTDKYGAMSIFYETRTALHYFGIIIGSVISDSSIGRFRQIVSFSMLAIVGQIILALSVLLGRKALTVILSFMGFMVHTICTAGLFASLIAFCSDQISTIDNAKKEFLYAFLFICTALAEYLSDLFRAHTLFCYMNISCTFGIVISVVVTSIIMQAIFIAKRSRYIVEKKVRNVFCLNLKLIKFSLARKFRLRKENVKLEHFLDYSYDIADKKIVDDLKSFLNVLLFCLPYPLFWWFKMLDDESTYQQFKKLDSVRSLEEVLWFSNSYSFSGMIMGLCFCAAVYPLRRKFGSYNTAHIRIIIAYIVIALSYLCGGIYDKRINEALRTPSLPNNKTASIKFISLGECNITMAFSNDSEYFLDVGGISKEFMVEAFSNTTLLISSPECGVLGRRKTLFINGTVKYTIPIYVSKSSIVMKLMQQPQKLKPNIKLLTYVSVAPSILSKPYSVLQCKKRRPRYFYWFLNKRTNTSKVLLLTKTYKSSPRNYDFPCKLGLKDRDAHDTTFNRTKMIEFREGAIIIAHIALIHSKATNESYLKIFYEHVVTLFSYYEILPRIFLGKLGEFLFYTGHLSFAIKEAPSAFRTISVSMYWIGKVGGILILRQFHDFELWHNPLIVGLTLSSAMLQAMISFYLSRKVNYMPRWPPLVK